MMKIKKNAVSAKCSMAIKKQYLFLLALSIFGVTQLLQAQPVYKIQQTKDIDMKLSGTSTLHDWVMTAQNTTGAAQFGFKGAGDRELNVLKSLTFSLIVTDLK